jgi:serine phosphatase RsbU (regulator of sigma subunit)
MTERVRTLLHEVREKAAVEREVEVASALQSTLVPESSTARLPGIELAGFFRPAAKCGGDWWSYYELVEERVLVVIGDVTGHGLPSAMITAVVKGAASNMVSVTRGSVSPDALLQELHGAVLQTARGRFAMTCFASIYDPRSRSLRYANAGHTFPYLYRGGEGRWLEVRGSMLGDEGCCSHQTGEVQLDPDDLLVWYTDGVVEGQAPGGEPFGYGRLTASVREHDRLPADKVRDEIIAEMYRHFGDVVQEDDITLVVGKVAADRSS